MYTQSLEATVALTHTVNSNMLQHELLIGLQNIIFTVKVIESLSSKE